MNQQQNAISLARVINIMASLVEKSQAWNIVKQRLERLKMQREVRDIYVKHGYEFKDTYFRNHSAPIITGDGFDPIFNTHNPPILRKERFRHYTDAKAALGILNNEIWLSSAIKRINEHEFESLYAELQMIGIFENSKSDNADTIKDEIAKTYFYLSLTEANLSESEDAKFRSIFGGSDSVRFTFEIDVSKPCMRKVDYSGKSPDIIRELNELAIRYGKKMTFNGGKLFAGIRLNHYSSEKETRLYYSTTIDALNDESIFVKAPFLHLVSRLNNPEIGFKINITEVSTTNQDVITSYADFLKRQE